LAYVAHHYFTGAVFERKPFLSKYFWQKCLPEHVNFHVQTCMPSVNPNKIVKLQAKLVLPWKKSATFPLAMIN
jgi:hypothetical protein